MITASSLALSPLLPLPLIAGLAAPTLVLAAYGLWRRVPGSLLRAATALGLVAVLLNPSLVTEHRTPLPDVALIVTDRSPSQQLGTRPSQSDTALAAVTQKLRALPDLDVRLVESPSGGDETHLFDLIDQTLSDVPPQRRAGIVLLTDGQVHDVPAADTTSSYGPVHVLLSGKPGESDRRLTVTQAPGYGLVGQSVTAKIRIDDQGSTQRSGQKTTLILRDENNQTATQEVETGREITLSLPIHHAGINLTELEVAPLEGEITPLNNRAALMVNGIRDRLRVLLISGHPHNGERTWRNLFKSDPSVDLVHFTILRLPENADFVPQNELSLIPFPTHELFSVKLRQFDLVVFDRFSGTNILPPRYLDNIADYVREGGALLDATGADLASSQGLGQSVLAPLLPSQAAGGLMEGPFVPKVTALGLRHPVTGTLPGLTAEGTGPWGQWYRMSGVLAGSTSQVLMSGLNGAPLLLLEQAGKGRVAQLTSEQIWLWARGHDGGGPQVELTRPLVHWLMKEPELEAEQITAQVDGAVIHLTRRTLKPDNTPLTATLPDGRQHSVSMSDDGKSATGRLDVSGPGIYRFSDGRLAALTIVGRANAPELADQRATPERLEPLATASGGGLFWLADAPQGPDFRRISAHGRSHGDDWAGLRRNGEYTVSGLTTTPALPLWPVAALLLAVLLGSWKRETR